MSVPFIRPADEDGAPADAAAALRVAQIVAVALIMGELVFGAVVGYLAFNGGSGLWPAAPAAGANAILGMDPMAVMISGIALLMAVTTTPMAFILRAQILNRARDRETGVVDPQAVLGASIMSLALLEGYGLLGLVGCLISRSVLPGAIPAAVSVLMIVVLFPREGMLRARGAGPFGETQRWA